MRPYARRRRRSRLLLWLVPVLLLLACGIPAARAAELVEERAGGSPALGSLPGTAVQFTASDGVHLAGWLTGAAPGRASIVLVPGFKADRDGMVPYARFLSGRYNVLLYDSRGTGLSDGQFTAGPKEVDDVLGATRYLQHRLPGTHIGVLGVSLGAGVALVATARDRGIHAVVADSAYADQGAMLAGLDHLHLGPLHLPLVPDAPWVIDALGGVSIEGFRPIDAIGHIAPRPILLIHSRHDANPTTPLSGAERLQAAAGSNARLWIAPHGGHAGALAAQPVQYQSRVLSFFSRSLGP